VKAGEGEIDLDNFDSDFGATRSRTLKVNEAI